MSTFTLAPREASIFPYERFGKSFLPVRSARKMGSLINDLNNQYKNYKLQGGLYNRENAHVDFVDNLNFDELFALMNQFVEYVLLFRTQPSESTLNSLKTTLNRLEESIKEFDMHSVEELRKFVNRMQRILSTFHRARDIRAYMVDLTGTFDPNDREPAYAFTDKNSAMEFVAREGNDESAVYEVFAVVTNKGEKPSKQVDSGMWKIQPNDIFSISECM